MWVNDIIDHIKLPFRKEKELFSALYQILGFYPHDLTLYKQALLHKSMGRRNEKGKPVNNERLEFLGDAILDAVVGDIVYRHFEGKREGFLTNTRSKLVSRDTLGKLSKEMGIAELITSASQSTSHNSYMNGNAFEALVGAIYLDRGYNACMRFMQKRILAQLINIDKVAYKEVNFKSKLLEWSQKNRVKLEFRELSQTRDDKGSPLFTQPDMRPVFQSDMAEENIQDAIIRIVDLQPQLTDNDGRDQKRHKIYGKKSPLTFDLFAERQGKAQGQRQLQKYRKAGQQQ